MVYQKIEGDILHGDNDDKFFMLKSNDGKNWEKSIDPFEGTGCGLSASRKISVGFESGGAIFFNCAGLTDSITIKSVDGVKWSELQSVLNPIELKYAGSEWRLTEDKRLEARSSPTVDWKGVDLKAPLTDELDASNEEDAYTVLYDLLYVVDSAMYAKVKIKESYFAEPEFQLWKSIP